MSFWKSLISQFLPGMAERNSAALADHYDRLHFLQDRHEWIDVTVCKTGEHYQSLILALDPDQKELIIDELYPVEQNLALESGDRLEINSQSKRAPVNFFTRLLSSELRQGETAYRLELPEEIGIMHSRGAYRVYVENEVGLEIELPHDGVSVAAVRVINLSTDGIKLWLPADTESLLHSQSLFEGAVVRLPDGHYIDCDIHLRNHYLIRTPHPHLLAGGSLTISQAPQRVKLQQYLASVQRKQRRKQTREL